MADTDDRVELTDLDVIARYSLAVRAATAPRHELIAALRADLEWLQGGRTRRSSAAAPAAPVAPAAPAAPEPVRRSTPDRRAPAAKKATAKKAVNSRAPGARKSAPAAKKTTAKKAAAKKTTRRR
jgi:hypothetical protein